MEKQQLDLNNPLHAMAFIKGVSDKLNIGTIEQTKAFIMALNTVEKVINESIKEIKSK